MPSDESGRVGESRGQRRRRRRALQRSLQREADRVGLSRRQQIRAECGRLLAISRKAQKDAAVLYAAFRAAEAQNLLDKGRELWNKFHSLALTAHSCLHDANRRRPHSFLLPRFSEFLDGLKKGEYFLWEDFFQTFLN